jgi:hypothetical protein
MIREDKQKAGFLSLISGVDSSRSPAIITEDSAAWAGNSVFRGGYPTNRPGYNQYGLTYPNTEIAEWFEQNVLQEAIIYSWLGISSVVASVGGRIFTFPFKPNVPDRIVQEITPTGATATAAAFTTPAAPPATVTITLNNAMDIRVGYPIIIGAYTFIIQSKSTNTITVTMPNAPAPVVVPASTPVIFLDPNSDVLSRAWMKQAEQFVIIQDGQSRAIIFDGSKTFRSDVTKFQVPTGTAMAYGQGRLWVAQGHEFVAGDIVRGPSGSPVYGLTDALLYFTENNFLKGGGAFAVPVQAGNITAMEFMPVLDTSTGQGPLAVFTETSAFTVNASTDRDTWQNSRSPVQSVVLTHAGAMNDRATIAGTNGDLFFRRHDGVGSLVLAIREFTSSWGNTPVSSELDRALRADDRNLLFYGSAIVFDNRYIFTVFPQRSAQAGGDPVAHWGLGSLDFHPINGMRSKAPPAYDGIWTGLRITRILTGVIDGQQRAFAFALNDDNLNEFWELSKEDKFDNTDGRIKSFLETRAMFGKNPFELTRLESVELFLDEVAGKVDFTLFYRPDQYPCWVEWGRAQSECAEWRDTRGVLAICVDPVVRRPGFKTRLNFGQPVDIDLDADDKPSRLGYDFQFRIEWEGKCRIRKMIARFTPVPDETYPQVQ